MMNENNEMDLNMVELTDADLDEVSGGKKSLYVKSNNVNVRSGPGKEYHSIALMGKGDELLYKGEKKKDKEGKTWLKVDCIYMIGWVRSDLVRK